MKDRAERIAWFKGMVLPHEAALRRYLRRIGSPPSDIDDLVSDAFVRAYSNDGWSSIKHGRSYLFKIARNMVIDAARREKVVKFETFADVGVLNIYCDQPSADAIVIARDELRALEIAINALPPRARQVFLLRRVQDLSPREIGQMLGLSVKTVEGHIGKALATLTKALKEHDPITQSATEPLWRTKRHDE